MSRRLIRTVYRKSFKQNLIVHLFLQQAIRATTKTKSIKRPPPPPAALSIIVVPNESSLKRPGHMSNQYNINDLFTWPNAKLVLLCDFFVTGAAHMTNKGFFFG